MTDSALSEAVINEEEGERSEKETIHRESLYLCTKNMETLRRLPFKVRNAVFKKLEEIESKPFGLPMVVRKSYKKLEADVFA